MGPNLSESPASDSALGASHRIPLRVILGKLQASGRNVWLILKLAHNCDGGDVGAPVDEAVVAKTRR